MIVFAIFTCTLLFSTTNAFAYEVKRGDTMTKISKKYGLSLGELIRLNPQVKNPNLIFIGQTIHTSGNSSSTVSHKTNVSANDRDLLARLVRAEAGGEPYDGKVAVAIVVLNRVDSPDFPNTVHDVIYQKGQFSPVANGQINQPADNESRRAVDEAIAYDRSRGYGSLYFYNPELSPNSWLKSRPTTKVIGHHVFKK
ncbi:cell wall hydrolase [Fictibacillus sp. Mic-4]